jgi:hypothetical protein
MSIAIATEKRPPAEDRFKSVIYTPASKKGDIERGIVGIALSVIKLFGAYDVESPLSLFMVNMAKDMISSAESKDLISDFIKSSYPYWDDIYERKDSFLLENATMLFGNNENLSMVAPSVSKFFALMLQKSFVTTKGKKLDSKSTHKLIEALDQSRNEMWEFMKACVRISISFIHVSREPQTIDGKTVYTKNAFDNIKIKPIIEKWEVKI